MLEGERLLECMALLFEVLRVEDGRTNEWMINMWLKIAGCDGWMDWCCFWFSGWGFRLAITAALHLWSSQELQSEDLKARWGQTQVITHTHTRTHTHYVLPCISFSILFMILIEFGNAIKLQKGCSLLHRPDWFHWFRGAILTKPFRWLRCTETSQSPENSPNNPADLFSWT